jgi:hypothetical protein
MKMAGEVVKTDAGEVRPLGGWPSRIGWEFWERPPLTPFPLEDQEPRLLLPAPPNVALIARQHKGKRPWGTVLLCLGSIVALAGVSRESPGWLMLALALAASGYLLLTAGARASKRANEAYARAAAAAEADHRTADAAWRSERERWYADESRRVEALPLYYVLNQTDHTRRLDVFGGSAAGWASLLNTLARPLIDHAIGVAVLDFTESSVGVELCLHAADAGRQVRHGLFPTDLHRVDLLQGLEGSEVVEVLIAASHAVRERRGREDEEHHEVDRAILAEVCRLLEAGGLTLQRIATGLDVANQVMGSGVSDVVTAAERTALEESGYLTAAADRVRERYPYLRPRLESLTAMATTDALDVTALPRGSEVSILAVEGSGRRELSLLANLIVQCTSQRLRGQRADGPAPLIVVVGADVLTFETISTLARRARRAGARTAFLFSNLEEDARRLLGTEGSDTLFFQLQNHEQAQFAADFIGRRHRFVIGQITKSVSDSLGGSHGENRSWSGSVTETVGGGASYSGLFKLLADSTSKFSSQARSWADTTGTQWSATWQKTDTYGETATRVYEYDTEPRTLQELDTTSFVLVSRVGGRTRIAAGDCNPGLERIADAVDYPRELSPHRGGPPTSVEPQDPRAIPPPEGPGES